MKTRGVERYTDILALWRHGQEFDPGSRLDRTTQARLHTAGAAIGPVIMTALPRVELETRTSERFLTPSDCTDAEELIAAAARAGVQIEPIRYEGLTAEELAAARAALIRGNRSVRRLVDQTMGYCNVPAGVRPVDCIANTGTLYVVPAHGMLEQDTERVMAELGLHRQQVIDGATIAAAAY